MRMAPAMVALIAGALGTSLFAGPQDQNSKASVEQQLQTQYVLTKMSGKTEIATPGSPLIILKEDVIGAAASGLAYYQNNYKDGHVKHGFSNLITQKMGAGAQRTFQVGECVYLLKTEVKENNLTFYVMSCEAYEGERYRAALTFQFPKGFLATTDFNHIQPTIGQVFKISDEASAGAQPQQPVAPAVQQPEQAMPPIPPPPPPPPPPDAPQPPPKTIALGQSVDEVVSILGPPLRTAKLPNKEIYIFKDLKVTFVKGKVSDVE
jgi:hypothetical protein